MFSTDINFGTVGASNPAGVYNQNVASGANGIGSMPGWNAMQSFNNLQVGNPVGATPNVGGGQMPGTGPGTGLGMNLGTGQLVLGGIQAIGNLWAAWEAQKLAREQFDYGKGVTDTNLTNSIQSYNTSLADRINARAFTEGRPDGYAAQYIEDNRARDMR